MTVGDELRSFIEQVQKQQLALMEEMCEKSLLDPEQRGVLVVSTHPKDSYIVETVVSLSAEVPWGQIHYKTVWADA